MKIAFNPSTVAALITPPNNKDITFDLRGRNIFARGVKFLGTDTWRDIKINNVSIGSNTLDLRNGSNTTLTNTNGVVTINSTWRPVVDNLTSDSTTSSLSAKQGKVLKSLIDGKSNSGHTHDDRYLKLTGGTMASNALITFADSGSWGTDKGPQGARGGLYWTGQSDYAKLYAEETVGDNLDLVIQFGDDNSNGLSIRNKANTQTSYISAGGVITTGTFKGNLDWSYITNKPSSYTPSAHTHAWNSLTHSSTTENQAILTNGKANGWKLYTLNISRWDNAANNAHSHANKSVLDGITSALVNNWNVAYTFVNTITGTDTDKVINKWDEIVNFLAGITEDNKLNTLLNSKLSVYKLADNTNVGAIKNNGIYYSTTDASSGTLTNSPFNTGFALINMTSLDNGDDLRRSRLAFNAYGEIKVSNDRDLANTAETWYNVLTSKNSGINGSTIKLNGTSITVYSSSTADGRYVKKSGDTMSGVLTIDTTNFGALTIKRNDDANGASIQFRGKSSVYGYIGLNNSTKDKLFLRWNSDTSKTYTILDTSSTYTSNGKGVINGTTITQVDNATNSTNSTNARKLVNWYSARPTSLNTQFGDGSLRIFYATSSTTEGKPAEDSHILHLAWDNNGGWDTQLAVHTRSGKVSTRAQNSGTWQPWKTLAFTTDIPSSLKNPYSLTTFGVVYDGSAAKTVTTSTFISLVTEGTSTITDGTMFITSYASNSGFADTNAVNVPYKRKAIHLWEYIKMKTDSLYAAKGHNHDDRYVRAFGTSNDNIDSDWGLSFKTFDPIPSGTPPEKNPNISILNIGNNFNRRKLLAFIYSNDNIYYRRHVDGSFTNWRRLAFANEIPTSLKNPYALTISLNGTSQGPYDGSAAKNINITPSSIGAAVSNHSHNYAANENYGGFTKSGRLPISGFYQSNASESGSNAPWSGWMHLINCLHSNTGNNYALLIAASFFDNNTFKIRVTNNNVNNAWRDIIHSGNIGSQLVKGAYMTPLILDIEKLISSGYLASDYTNGYDTVQYMKAAAKYLLKNYPGYSVFGTMYPNGRGFFTANIYGNGFNSNGNPEHITIHYYPHGGNIINCGTTYGSWYYNSINRDGSSYKLQTARKIWGQSFDGTADISGNMSSVGLITFSALSGTNGRALLYLQMADNDYFRIYAGGTASNSGYVEIATADDGNEPIYVRQYTGVFSSVKRTLTLLDGSGNTTFPGSLSIGGNIIFPNSSHLLWNSGSWYLRILLNDDSTADTAVFTFLQSSDSGTNWSNLMTIRDNGKIIANTFVGALLGNASTATALTTSAGSATLPIYFSGGKPIACTASLVFSNLSNSGNNLSITVAGQNRTLTVRYAASADTVDGYHIADESRQVYKNYYTVASPAGAWILIKFPAWNGYNEIVTISGAGDNRGAHCVVHCGSRNQGIWGYQSDYNGKVVDRIRWKEVDSGKFALVVLISGGITNLSIKSTNSLEISKTTEDTNAFTITSNFFSSSGVFHGNVDWDKIIGKPSSFTPSAHNHDGRYLRLDGSDTMTGVFKAKANQYNDGYDGAINMNNSDIYGLNSIYTADRSDAQAEGIHFWRDSTHVDTLRMVDGKLLFTPNRPLGGSGTEQTVLHTGNSHIKGGIITINGSSLTPLTSLPSHTHSWTSITDKLVAGNEFNIVNAGFKEGMWFNYLPINDRSKTATITGYHFGNGATGYTSINASGFIKKGSNSNYVLLGDGGHKLESSLNVANADTVDNYHETAFPRLVGIKGGTWNWNDVIRAGYYKIQSGTITNHPSGIYPFGMAEVITTENHNDGENRELQIYYPHSQTNNIAIWLRMHNSSTQGNGWGSWVGVPNTNGNIASATKLLTTRLINGTNFDGTSNITTSYWGTTRTISLIGAVTGSVSTNGSGNITINTTYSTGNITNLDNRYVKKAGDTMTGMLYINSSGGFPALLLKNTGYGSNYVLLGIGLDNDFLMRNVINGASIDLRFNSTSLRYKGQTVWHSGNDGSGSGLDADLLDGLHASAFSYKSWWHWSGLSGQPSWIWGGNSENNYYVYNPSNFSVNYANSAGNADKLDGIHANGLLTALSNSNNGISITVGGTTKSVSNISVNYASSAGSATKVIVNLHTTNDTNYPLVWSNLSNTNSVTENQLYKSWSDLYYNPKNKRLTVGGSVVASSFVKRGGTSLQLLRADGGIAAFNWSGQSGLPSWLWGGNNEHSYYVYNPSNFRVAYATSSGNADTALYLRSLGNLNCQTGRTLNYGDVYTYNTYDGNTGSPTTFTSVIGFGRGIAGTVEIAGGWDNTNLYWRSLRDCCENWHSWRTVLDSSNYTEFINNYYWANVKISTSSSTTTSPTVSNLTATSSIRMGNIYLLNTNEINSTSGIHLNYQNSGNISLCAGGGKVGIGTISPSYKLDVNGLMRASGFHHSSMNNDNYILLAGGGYKSFGGDSSHPVFLGYLNLDHGSDGTVSSSFYCLGYSVPFTYTRGGNYCKISIPDTTHQAFYIKAATASVNYSGGGMDTWTGNHRGAGAWWLHCYAPSSNEVRVKGFHLKDTNNDSWWGGNPLWSDRSGVNRITVCIFGYVTFR